MFLLTPYVAKYIKPDDMALLNRIETAVQTMPDINLGDDKDGKPIILSCHMLTKALGRIFPSLKEKTGFYRKIYQHSWLITSNGNLIDVYPIATIGGPIMLAAKPASPQINDYISDPNNIQFKGIFSQPHFNRSVRRLTKILRSVMPPEERCIY